VVRWGEIWRGGLRALLSVRGQGQGRLLLLLLILLLLLLLGDQGLEVDVLEWGLIRRAGVLAGVLGGLQRRGSCCREVP
jgi:hypothetical protein